MKKKKYDRKVSMIKGAAALIDGLKSQFSSPADSALLAAMLIEEFGWSPRQARLVTGAGGSYLHMARHLDRQQLAAIEAGTAKLSTYHNSRAGNGNGNGSSIF
jgi:hypothetical protein